MTLVDRAPLLRLTGRGGGKTGQRTEGVLILGVNGRTVVFIIIKMRVPVCAV